MGMSVYTEVYKRLSSRAALTDLLAASTIIPDGPAIYEKWATKDSTPMPYINMIYKVGGSSDNLDKRRGTAEAHIFTEGDTILAEQIGREVKKALLLGERSESADDGMIRIYLDTGEQSGHQPTESTDVVHWGEYFQLIYWDLDIIKNR